MHWGHQWQQSRDGAGVVMREGAPSSPLILIAIQSQCVYTTSGLNESPLSSHHGNQIRDSPRLTHTPQPPSPTLPEAWKSVWECVWMLVGECVSVCVFVSLLRLLSRIDRGLLKPKWRFWWRSNGWSQGRIDQADMWQPYLLHKINSRFSGLDFPD